MNYKIIPAAKKDFLVSKYIHSVFFEYFGRVIYDGIWVGKDSSIPNIDGIRLDVIQGCRELNLGAMRWPGGCCADHYHWKDGIGPQRFDRIHPAADFAGIPLWRHDFGTDEFMKFCQLTGTEPVLTVNTATGSPEEFLDWLEYVNGPATTKYGHLRAENGHLEPYNVKFWGIGNTDENVWHIDYNNPVAYGQTYLKYQTVAKTYRPHLYFIGLGLSMRHGLPGWTGKALDHITHNQHSLSPNALSVHNYLGGAKQAGEKCGGAVDYTDEGWYALMALLERYQYDIDLHRITIREHTRPEDHTKICFDEWGLWHPEASPENLTRQPQTLRDGLFAALTLPIFYRNSDIVEFAMETQLSNLLQSLFETDGEKFYKTPTFYIMKLFKEHANQYLIPLLPDDLDEHLDTVATLSADGTKMTISIINFDLYQAKFIDLHLEEPWHVTAADIVTAEDVRICNTYEEPEYICDRPFDIPESLSFTAPAHSVIRICLEK